MIAKIAIDGAASGRLFDYAVPPELAATCAVGARVRVHFGRRAVLGYVAELVEESDFLATNNAAKAPVQAPSDLLFDVVPELQKPALKPVEAVDGDAPVSLQEGARVVLRRSDKYLELLTPDEASFYEKIKTKLFGIGRSVPEER